MILASIVDYVPEVDSLVERLDVLKLPFKLGRDPQQQLGGA